jgi:hypothetical protein
VAGVFALALTSSLTAKVPAGIGVSRITSFNVSRCTSAPLSWNDSVCALATSPIDRMRAYLIGSLRRFGLGTSLKALL